MKISLSEIAQATHGRLIASELELSSFSIDSRQLQRNDLYIAISGEKFDGHDFIAEAEAKGAAACVLSRDVDTNLPKVKVQDTRLALAQIASAWRQKFKLQLVGLTGSNGKTTVKEMIASILAVKGNVLATQGNLNNEIGVPLSLLSINDEHEYAVLEMGANHAGEIAFTGSVAQPDIALITNASAAHTEGFGTVEGVAAAKGELIGAVETGGYVVLNGDSDFFNYWKALAEQHKVISFGQKAGSEVSSSEVKVVLKGSQFKTTFVLHVGQSSTPIEMSLVGVHNVNNALAATAVTTALGCELRDIQTGLAAIQPVPGRMQPLSGLQGEVVINDSYNANPASMQAALDVLSDLQLETWVAFGAFAELGEESGRYHDEVGRCMKESGITRLFAIGPDADKTVKSFGAGAQLYSSQLNMIKALQQEITAQQIVLVKGSRAQRMENVVNALVKDGG
ncbi:MAG: UDP-N-acetylmuramoyl-tripeptide--D-alanyl-D-alanine ligase [Methylococcaceae bacterium]